MMICWYQKFSQKNFYLFSIQVFYELQVGLLRGRKKQEKSGLDLQQLLNKCTASKLKSKIKKLSSGFTLFEKSMQSECMFLFTDHFSLRIIQFYEVQ